MLEDIQKAVEVLKDGGTILYPTDTIWGIGCDATNARAVEKVYRIKKRLEHKSLIILVDGLDMLRQYVASVPEMAADMIESIREPLTIIYDKGCNLAKNVPAADGSIAIRIPRDTFLIELIRTFGKPITSSSANLSGGANPISYSRIDAEIREAVDYICTTNQQSFHMARPSTIIRIDAEGQIQIIRS